MQPLSLAMEGRAVSKASRSRGAGARPRRWVSREERGSSWYVACSRSWIKRLASLGSSLQRSREESRGATWYK